MPDLAHGLRIAVVGGGIGGLAAVGFRIPVAGLACRPGQLTPGQAILIRDL
jgi:hypothetical protein